MTGGYTQAQRWIVQTADDPVFVKASIDEESASWLRAEWLIYSQVQGPFLPELRGWIDAQHPVLLLQDLSQQHWPPPWSDGDVEKVLHGLEQIAAWPVPAGIPSLESDRDSLMGWSNIGKDPTQFLSLGQCSRRWLEAALTTLIEAETAVDLSGNALLHLDVRGDNVCITNERAVFVDWNWAMYGAEDVDLAFWAPSLYLEGGPEPVQLMGKRPKLASLVSGYFANMAGMPPPNAQLRRVRALQLASFKAAFPWACESLGLVPPEPV